MKDFIKYLWEKKVKLAFLVFVMAFMGILIYYIPEFEPLFQIIAVVFVIVVGLASFLQVWREYKQI